MEELVDNVTKSTNHTRNGTCSILSSHEVVIKNVMLGVYLTTMVIGIVGNTVTISAIIATRQTRSMANCFILNLAVADNLFVCSLPFQAHSSYTGTWVFGDIMCHVLNPFYEFNLFASIFTMVLMSIDRYIAVKHPLTSREFRTTKNAIMICVLIWVVSFIVVTPTWLFARATDRSCSMDLSKHPDADIFWKYFELCLGFLLPIIIMIACYSRLVRNLKSDSRGVLQDQSHRPVKKVTLMVIIVTVVFILCWTPYHAMNLLGLQMKKKPRSPEEYCRLQLPLGISYLVAQGLVFVSSCCNPFIYWISSPKFRRMWKLNTGLTSSGHTTSTSIRNTNRGIPLKQSSDS